MSEDRFKKFNSLLNSQHPFDAFSNFGSEVHRVNDEIYRFLVCGEFWHSKSLKEFQDLILKFENTFKPNCDSVIDNMEKIVSMNRQIRNKEMEIMFSSKDEEKKRELLEEEVEDLKNEQSSLYLEITPPNQNEKDSTERGLPLNTDEEDNDTFTRISRNQLRETRRKIRNYSLYLKEVKDFINVVIRSLKNESYQVIKFGDYLGEIIKKEEKDSRMPTVYLLKTWEIELNTVCDYREHIGLKEEHNRIIKNINYIASTEGKFFKEDKSKQQQLLRFLKFMKWKYEISEVIDTVKNTSPAGALISEKAEPEEFKTYEDIVEFFNICLKAEQQESEDKGDLINSGLLAEIIKQKDKNYSAYSLTEKWAYVTYLKDFCDEFSSENLEKLEIIKDSITIDLNSPDQYKEILNKNKLFFENHYLSYINKWYGQMPEEILLSVDRKLKKIEKGRKSYFKLYKLGCIYLQKARSEILNDSFSNLYKKAEKFQKEAKTELRKNGLFSYPFQPPFEFSKKYGIFSVSTFIQHKTNNDLERIEKLGMDIHTLKGLKELKVIEEKTMKEVENNGKQLVQGFQDAISSEQKEGIKRVVEVLAIFSALVLFASGSIQLYEDIRSIKAAVVFTLFFAAALSFFAMLILVIVRKKEHRLLEWIVGGFLLVVLIASGLYVLLGEDIIVGIENSDKDQINISNNQAPISLDINVPDEVKAITNPILAPSQ